MAGRPSKLTEQVEADLTLLLAQGVPVKLAASATNVSPRSVRRWMREGDLRERVAEVRAGERTPAEDATNQARLVVLLLKASEYDWRASARLVAGAALAGTLGALRGCRRERRTLTRFIEALT